MSSLPESTPDEEPVSAVAPVPDEPADAQENTASEAEKPTKQAARAPRAPRTSTPRAKTPGAAASRPTRPAAQPAEPAARPTAKAAPKATPKPAPKPRAPRAPRAKTAASDAASTTAAKPRTPRSPRPATAPPPAPAPVPKPTALDIRQLYKRFGSTVALDGVSIAVPEGSFYGIVGPNGAGKTTMLSIVSGLLRPDSGQVVVHDVDVWKEPNHAKHLIGVLPDRLRLFDRLTGAQLLHYSGTLRGLDAKTVPARVESLVTAFGLENAMGRLVADYSAGMTKKIALAAALIHSPRVLVLDEPFESVDPVSAANITEILQKYVASGGTVVLSSHSMDLIQRVCDHVAIIVAGVVLDSGATEVVRGGKSLEERFVELAGGRKAAEGLEWLHSFSE